MRKELAQGPVLTSLVGYDLSYNTLDNNRNPTSGMIAVLKPPMPAPAISACRFMARLIGPSCQGLVAGLRYEQWKAVFLEQKAHGFDVWAQPMVQLRLPMLFNLRSDPFERAQHEAGDYVKWFVEHAFVLVPAQSLVAQHLESFKQFPPRQKPGSFSVEQAMEKLRNPPSSN